MEQQRAYRVIRIGVSEARITEVNRDRIQFVDEQGEAHSISLDRKGRYVGLRDALDTPPWVKLGKPITRFEFHSYDELYEELLTPLRKVGSHTIDLG